MAFQQHTHTFWVTENPCQMWLTGSTFEIESCGGSKFLQDGVSGPLARGQSLSGVWRARFRGEMNLTNRKTLSMSKNNKKIPPTMNWTSDSCQKKVTPCWTMDLRESLLKKNKIMDFLERGERWRKTPRRSCQVLFPFGTHGVLHHVKSTYTISQRHAPAVAAPQG